MVSDLTVYFCFRLHFHTSVFLKQILNLRFVVYCLAINFSMILESILPNFFFVKRIFPVSLLFFYCIFIILLCYKHSSLIADLLYIGLTINFSMILESILPNFFFVKHYLNDFVMLGYETLQVNSKNRKKKRNKDC